MIDTSGMTDAAFLRTLRMRYHSVEQPEITSDEIRRLLNIASGLTIFRSTDRQLSPVFAAGDRGFGAD